MVMLMICPSTFFLHHRKVITTFKQTGELKSVSSLHASTRIQTPYQRHILIHADGINLVLKQLDNLLLHLYFSFC